VNDKQQAPLADTGMDVDDEDMKEPGPVGTSFDACFLNSVGSTENEQRSDSARPATHVSA
jgi:hypothetical protein